MPKLALHDLRPELQAVLLAYQEWGKTRLSPATAAAYRGKIHKLLRLWQTDARFANITSLEEIVVVTYDGTTRANVYAALASFDEFSQAVSKDAPQLAVSPYATVAMTPAKLAEFLIKLPSFTKVAEGGAEKLPASVIWACYQLATKEYYRKGVDWQDKLTLFGTLGMLALEDVPSLFWASFVIEKGSAWVTYNTGSHVRWFARWQPNRFELARRFLWAWGGWGDHPPQNAIVLPARAGDPSQSFAGVELRKQYRAATATGWWSPSYIPPVDFDPQARMNLASLAVARPLGPASPTGE